jgi:hypothetical protein
MNAITITCNDKLEMSDSDVSFGSPIDSSGSIVRSGLVDSGTPSSDTTDNIYARPVLGLTAGTHVGSVTAISDNGVTDTYEYTIVVEDVNASIVLLPATADVTAVESALTQIFTINTEDLANPGSDITVESSDDTIFTVSASAISIQNEDHDGYTFTVTSVETSAPGTYGPVDITVTADAKNHTSSHNHAVSATSTMEGEITEAGSTAGGEIDLTAGSFGLDEINDPFTDTFTRTQIFYNKTDAERMYDAMVTDEGYNNSGVSGPDRGTWADYQTVGSWGAYTAIADTLEAVVKITANKIGTSTAGLPINVYNATASQRFVIETGSGAWQDEVLDIDPWWDSPSADGTGLGFTIVLTGDQVTGISIVQGVTNSTTYTDSSDSNTTQFSGTATLVNLTVLVEYYVKSTTETSYQGVDDSIYLTSRGDTENTAYTRDSYDAYLATMSAGDTFENTV